MLFLHLRNLIVILLFLGAATQSHAVDTQWFQTWDRKEYQEWAHEIPEGYLIFILRKQEEDYFVARAKILLQGKGLPGFEVIEVQTVPDLQTAVDCLKNWENAFHSSEPSCLKLL